MNTAQDMKDNSTPAFYNAPDAHEFECVDIQGAVDVVVRCECEGDAIMSVIPELCRLLKEHKGDEILLVLEQAFYEESARILRDSADPEALAEQCGAWVE